MFVYSLPPIDFFDGLIPIKKAKDFFDLASICQFTGKALSELYRYGKDWSIDIEGAKIMYGSIPKPYEPSYLFLMIKQCEKGGNGLSYIVSECPLPSLEENAECLMLDKQKRENLDPIKFVDYASKVIINILEQ